MILKNSSWIVVEQFTRMVAGLFIGIWIARHLGPADYGALSFALALSTLVGAFATLGLNRTVVRELALNNNDYVFHRRIIASVLFLRLLFSLFCYAATIALSLIFDQGQPLLVGVIAASITFTSFDVIDLYFQSKTASRYPVFARTVSFLAFFFVKVSLLQVESTVLEFSIVVSLEAMGNAVALWLTNRSFGIKISARDIDIRYGWNLILQSWPELLAGVACLVFMRIDQIMISNILGDAAVGQYAVASRLAEAWYFIPNALVASSFPSIVRLRATDKTLYLRRIRLLMTALVGLSYIVSIIVMLFAPWALNALFGHSYESSAHVLVILVWSGLFISLGIVSGSWIMAEAKPMLNLTRNAIGAGASIAFNFYLIPKYGTQGAAVGTLLALSFAYLFSDFLSPQTRHIGFIKLKALFLIWK